MRPQGQTVDVRVSSTDQNLARQLEAIGQVDRVFEDKASGGSRTQRHGLADCLKYIRDGGIGRCALLPEVWVRCPAMGTWALGTSRGARPRCSVRGTIVLAEAIV